MKPAKPSEGLSCLFASLDQFLSRLVLRGVEGAVECFKLTHSAVVHTPREESEYVQKKCSVMLSLMRFVTVLLNRHPKEGFSVRCVKIIFCAVLCVLVLVSVCIRCV